MENFEIGVDYKLRLKHPDPATGVSIKTSGSGLTEVYRLAQLYCHGKGLDIGPAYGWGDIRREYPGSVPVDLRIPDSGDATKLIQADLSQDYVFSSHCYEHVDDPEKAVKEAFRVLRTGGCLFLYLPFPGHSEWDPMLCEPARAVHLWQPTPITVARLLVMAGFIVEYCEWEKDQMWSFIVVGRKP